MMRFTAYLSLSACLMFACGGCLCHHGMRLHGDWSLSVDQEPCDCLDTGCQHGACHASSDYGGPGPGHLPPAELEPTPPPPPKFHPVPTQPVPTGALPHAAAASSSPHSAARQVSVLNRSPHHGQQAWVFSGGSRRSADPRRQAPPKRQLAESWQGKPPRR